MIYSSESWNCTKKEIRKLEGLQYRQLRSIFGKTWKDRISHVQLLQSIKFGPNFNFNWAVSDEDKTKDPNLSSVKTMIRLSRLRYCGHVLRMNDHRLPKQIMYSEADLGERSRGRPKKNFRGCIKEDLKSFRIWEECSRTNIATMASDRYSWKTKINSGASLHQLTWENQRTENSEKKKNRKNLAELG